MIKVFIPELNKKNKTTVRGFWKNDKGKIFYDYLTIKEFTEYPSYRSIEALRIKYNQEAIAIIGNSLILNIFYKNRQEVLPHRIYKEVGRIDLKVAIKEALKDFSGCTIYNDNGKYFIEVFTTI